MLASWAMPSPDHEGLVELFRSRETFAAEVAHRWLGVAMPAFEAAEVGDSVLSVPVELRADLVVVLKDGEGEPVFGLIVEVQLRKDERKRPRWVLYAAALHDRLKCPVAVMVVPKDQAVAVWASERLEVGPGHAFQPLVLGPDLVPRVTAAEAEQAPEMGVLSVIAHGHEADGLELALSVIPAISQIEDDARREMFYDLVAAGLSAAAQEELEAMALSGNYEFQSDVVKNLIARSQATGKAEGEKIGAHRALVGVLVKALQHRGVELDAALSTRIEQATSENLERWTLELMSGADIDQIFSDG